MIGNGKITTGSATIPFRDLAIKGYSGTWAVKDGENSRTIWFVDGSPIWSESTYPADKILRLCADWQIIDKKTYLSLLSEAKKTSVGATELLQSKNYIRPGQAQQLVLRAHRARCARQINSRSGEMTTFEAPLPAGAAKQPIPAIQVLIEANLEAYKGASWARRTKELAGQLLQLNKEQLIAQKSLIEAHAASRALLAGAKISLLGDQLIAKTSDLKPDSAYRLVQVLMDIGLLEVDTDSVRARKRTAQDVKKETKNTSADVEQLYADMQSKNAFEILGVADNSNDAAVKKAYFKLAKTYHPDKFFDRGANRNNESAEKIFSLIQQSYDELRTVERRQQYKNLTSTGSSKSEAVEEAQNLVKAELAFQKAEILVKRRSYDEAFAMFKEAVDLDPNEPEFRIQWGWAEFVSGWPDDTATADTGQKRISDSFSAKATPLAAYMLGRIYKIRENKAEAKKWFTKALEIDKKYIDASKELARL